MTNNYRILVSVLSCFFILNCEKQTIHPESNKPESPKNVRAMGDFRSVVLSWETMNNEQISGFEIYYGSISGNYPDTLLVDEPVFRAVVPGLEDNSTYFFAVSSIDINEKESHVSKEVSARTYFAFENFDHEQGPLDSSKWFYEDDLKCPVKEGKVAATEFLFNDVQIMKSFAQYLLFQPRDNFVVECQFQIGTPNVGGAGLMLRSQKFNQQRFYKGYHAYIFWYSNSWKLYIEESPVDRYAMPKNPPFEIEGIEANDWVKLSFKYNDGELTATVYRMTDLKEIGSMKVTDTRRGQRPNWSDLYCGFFTTQYGGNTIFADNFGIVMAD